MNCLTREVDNVFLPLYTTVASPEQLVLPQRTYFTPDSPFPFSPGGPGGPWGPTLPVLPTIGNQVKTAKKGNFLCFT